jgi:hypothetical protein
MSDWIVTIARRQAGLEPGFQGADESHEDFKVRLAEEEELVLGLGPNAAVAGSLPDTWAPPSYIPGPEPVPQSAEAPAPPAPPVVPPGDGWWLASDGQWYPPDAVPGAALVDAPPPPDAVASFIDATAHDPAEGV